MRPISKNLQKIFDAYPYDKNLKESYIAILEKDQTNEKIRELLTMQYLALGYKFFWKYMKDDDDTVFIYYLHDAVNYCIDWWKRKEDGMSFDTAVSNILKRRLLEYIRIKNTVEVPYYVVGKNQEKISVSSLSESPNPEYETNLYSSISANLMKEDFLIDPQDTPDIVTHNNSYQDILAEYEKSGIKTKNEDRNFEIFKKYNEGYSSVELETLFNMSRQGILNSIRKFEKDFKKFLINKGYKINADATSIGNNSNPKNKKGKE